MNWFVTETVAAIKIQYVIKIMQNLKVTRLNLCFFVMFFFLSGRFFFFSFFVFNLFFLFFFFFFVYVTCW